MAPEPGTPHADGAAAAPAVIDCTTAVQRMWDFLDRELDDARMSEVEAHLAACRGCPSHFAFAQSLLENIAAARAGFEQPQALRLRVVAALHAEGFVGQPS